MSNNYAGIDYTGPGSTVNRDPSTGIRYGVISQHSLMPEVMDDIHTEARDLSYERAKADLLSALQNAYLDEADESDEAQNHAISNALSDLYYEARRDERYGVAMELADAFRESRGWTQDLIDDLAWSIVGDRFNDAYQGDDHAWLWEQDGYALSNCLQSDIMVSRSPYFTYAQFCSPCVPGAGNLDSAFEWTQIEAEIKAPGAPAHWPDSIEYWARLNGVPKVFCLGHDFFENDEAPYPVFSVATGKRVVMVEKGIPCPSCKGTGIWALTGVTCGNCRGTGDVVGKVEQEQ